MTTVEQLVGMNLRDRRDEAEMTQDDLGEALKRYLGKAWSRPAVSAAEAGRRSFNAAELAALASILGCSVSAFFRPTETDQEVSFPVKRKKVPAQHLLVPPVEGALSGSEAELLQEGFFSKVHAGIRELEDLLETLGDDVTRTQQYSRALVKGGNQSTYRR